MKHFNVTTFIGAAIVGALLNLFAVAAALAAQPADVSKVPGAAAPRKSAPKPATGPVGTVLEHGYYQIETEGNLYPDPNAPSGRVHAGVTVKLVEQTDRIPIEKGRLFGFRFRVTGIESQDTVAIRQVVTHPRITKPDGTKSTGYETTLGLNVRLGEVTDYTGYRLDHDYELVEGVWKFEFWLGNKKLFEQSFTTVGTQSRVKQKVKPS